MKLNPRQEKFCIEYLKTGNATAAYQAAGFKSKSYQASQANSARLLADEKIQARLRELSAKIETENIADISLSWASNNAADDKRRRSNSSASVGERQIKSGGDTLQDARSVFEQARIVIRRYSACGYSRQYLKII